MTPNAIARKAALAELAKRKTQRDTVLFDKRPDPLTGAEWKFFLDKCHKKQQAFLLDPCKRKALLCPRRTGKTTTLMFVALIVSRQHPGSDIAYVVPSSKEHAQRLFWRPLRKMNEALQLGLEFKIADNCVVAPNGTHIYVFGAKNKDSAARLRGNAWSAVFLDECKDFGPHFEELMIEAAMPGLEDYDGVLILGGTPGSVLDGMFYTVTVKKPEGWSVHCWIKSDNSFLPPEARDLDMIERREYFPFGLNRDSPKFRREQLAEWCTDETERVYFYDDNRNGWHGNSIHDLSSAHKWHFVLGLDLGERDENAFIVFAFAMTCLEIYLVHEHHKARMSIDDIANHTKDLIKTYGAFTQMVADTGGYGRGIVTDLQTRHNLPFQPADKSGNKLGNIAQMNSDFMLGRIRANRASDTAMEWRKMTRRFRVSDKRVLLSHSDLGDAALYAWRASKHYAAKRMAEKPKEGSDEWYRQQEQEAVERALASRRQRGEWGGQALSDTHSTFYLDHA
jgi:hypothetical protein